MTILSECKWSDQNWNEKEVISIKITWVVECNEEEEELI